MVQGSAFVLTGARLIPLDAIEKGGEAGVQVSVVLDVLGIIEVSAGRSETVERLPEVVISVLISPGFALEDLHSFIILPNNINRAMEITD